MKLSVFEIESAKPRARPYKIGDGEGLYLTVSTHGTKAWRFTYSWYGQQRSVGLGRSPAVSLSDAREHRRMARKQLEEGVDPGEQVKLAHLYAARAAQGKFRSVAEDWVKKNRRDGLSAITLRKIDWILAMAYPVIGERPRARITAPELLSVLKKVEASGRYETARRMRSVMSRTFRYGIATGRAKRDIASDLRGAIATPRPKSHAALTNERDVRRLIRAVDDFSGTCLIPDFDGAVFSREWKDALWDRFYTGAPGRQRRYAAEYRIVKRA